MTTARDPIDDQFAPAVESGTRLTTWYAQGHADGFGDRLLMFDNTSAPSWEILRFKPSFAHDTKFETALRLRMERLISFHHPAFPLVRSIKELGHDHGLAVVSTYVSGVRLSDALKKPRSADFAAQLIRQLMPALNALHDHAPGLAHGAVTLDRVVLTADARLMIREHMLGSAVESLGLLPEQLWTDLGIFTLPTSPSLLDSRNDVAQLALVALSLVAGRRMGPDDYPHAIRELLDTIVRFEFLREWLERALQLGDHPFSSAREASDALVDLQNEGQRDDDGFDATLRLASAPAPPRREMPPTPPPRALEQDVRPSTEDVLRPSTEIVPVPPAAHSSGGGAIRWVAIVSILVALGEAAFIGRLLYVGYGGQGEATPVQVIETPQPRTDLPVNGLPAPVAPLPMNAEPEAPSIRVLPAVSSPEGDVTVREVPPATGNTESPASTAPRNGALRISSSIELHVLDGERVLGSSGEGPIIARAGRYPVDFVNSMIGYRVRREVEVKPGQVTSLTVTVPNGTLNVNATPWAAVWIDGTLYGETPLGNLSIVPGEHEIIFRHPQLGERRRRILVRPDVPGRIAEDLQR
jgi:hypothetical protein